MAYQKIVKLDSRHGILPTTPSIRLEEAFPGSLAELFFLLFGQGWAKNQMSPFQIMT